LEQAHFFSFLFSNNPLFIFTNSFDVCITISFILQSFIFRVIIPTKQPPPLGGGCLEPFGQVLELILSP
jgi:hypothetical protein